MQIPQTEIERQLTQRRLDIELLLKRIKALEVSAGKSSGGNTTVTKIIQTTTDDDVDPQTLNPVDGKFINGYNANTGTFSVADIPTPPIYEPNQIISGGDTVHVSNYVYRVSATEYILNKQHFNAPETEVTLSAPDASYDRIDVIAVDNNSQVIVIEGTPASTPVRPDIDPATQLLVTFVIVYTGTTEPPDVTDEDIYLENTEWTTAVSAHFNAASTNNPRTGTKCIEATAAVAANYISFTTGSLDISVYQNLIFYIRSKALWPRQKQLQLKFSNGTTIIFNDGAYGFVSSNTSTYQQIVIPISAFLLTGAITTLTITVAGGQGSIGFYLDDISLQAGVQPPTTTILPSDTVVTLDASAGAPGTDAKYSRADHKHAITGFVPTTYLDTDTNLTADSNTKIATQKATKAYVDSHAGGPGGTPSDTVADLDGTGAAGDATTYSRGNHKHADTARHTHANKTTLDNITAAYTSAEATKLAGIETGAEVNVNADFDAASGDAQILNKPPRDFGGYFKGTLTAGLVAYSRIKKAGTLTKWSILLDAGSCTIKVWKVAAGAALPTALNSISTSGVGTSGGTCVLSTTLTDFTTLAFAAGDIVAVCLFAVSGASCIEFKGYLE